jgi:23S rRNA G2069 N7-methylase RlmK/C1962 C5-methylase RlmI
VALLLVFYKEHFHQIVESVVDGGQIFLFLNTHSITRRQFKDRISQLIKASTHTLKIVEEYCLSADCPRLKAFPEGDYLKGLQLKKVK